MRRIYSCFNGHIPSLKKLPSDKLFLVCEHPQCQIATQLYTVPEYAIEEWNNGGSEMWHDYEQKWWHWIARWWHGTFY